MARMFTFVILSIGLILLLNMAGLPTGADGILGLVGLDDYKEGVHISLSNFWDNMFNVDIGILIAGVVAGITIGFFVKGQAENFLFLPLITGPLAVFISSFVKIINYSIGSYPVWVSGIVILTFAPFAVGYALSLAEYFRGNI